MPYAAVLHLSGKDCWEEFEASAFFLLADFSERENRVYPFFEFSDTIYIHLYTKYK